ncbi:hypothetical protein HID58_056059, partial [Brassica napus]
VGDNLIKPFIYCNNRDQETVENPSAFHLFIPIFAFSSPRAASRATRTTTTARQTSGRSEGLTNSYSPKKFRSRHKKLCFGPTTMPDCVVLFDAERKSSVILEAAKLQIPVVAIVDPNAPLEFFEKITYPVPARDSDEDGDRRWGHGQGLSCLIDLVMMRKASIDFAEFLTEADPLIVSLPLKFSNSGDVLNVTIEKIQIGIDLRFFKMKIRSILSKKDSFRSAFRAMIIYRDITKTN